MLNLGCTRSYSLTENAPLDKESESRVRPIQRLWKARAFTERTSLKRLDMHTGELAQRRLTPT